jgi:hypothetical protein
MALTTTSDYQNLINCLLWDSEVTTGRSVGNYNQDGSVQITPWVYDVLRYGYDPQDTTNYAPTGGVLAWPSGQSPTEAADQADLTAVITSYLAYKKARLSQDTNSVTVLRY